jgi:hypothetical protein
LFDAGAAPAARTAVTIGRIEALVHELQQLSDEADRAAFEERSPDAPAHPAYSGHFAAVKAEQPRVTATRCRRCRKAIVWPGLCYTCATGPLPRVQRAAEVAIELTGDPDQNDPVGKHGNLLSLDACALTRRCR